MQSAFVSLYQSHRVWRRPITSPVVMASECQGSPAIAKREAEDDSEDAMAPPLCSLLPLAVSDSRVLRLAVRAAAVEGVRPMASEDDVMEPTRPTAALCNHQ